MAKGKKKSSHTVKQARLPTISACMIVKNEEELLPQCLHSIKDLADEIIIVDTGSTDRTVEIAKSFGAKVFHHPWENDFSKHRNQSISYATGDWILIIDADEEIPPQFIENFRNTITRADINKTDYLYIMVRDCDCSGRIFSEMPSVRLFRRDLGLYYSNRVHNELCLKGRGHLSSLVLNHYGYALSQEKMKAKFNRTVTLLKKWLQESPEDPKPPFYLAKSYGMNKQHTWTIFYCLETKSRLDKISSHPLYLLEIYYMLAVSFYNLGMIHLVRGVCVEGLARFPDYLDLYYLLFVSARILKDTNGIHQWATAYLRCLERIKGNPTILKTLRIYTRVHEESVKKSLEEAIAHDKRDFAYA